jgi:mRNA interferase RelE/StbE
MSWAYTVEVELKAAKELAKIQKPNRARIFAKIKDLAVEPRPDGVVKLSGLNAYRLRVGDYRIVYTIEDSIRIVSIIRISHRSNVYQDRK